MREPTPVTRGRRLQDGLNGSASGEIIPFPETEMGRDMSRLIKAIESNTLVLTELTEAATGVIKFLRRWVPWAVAGLAVAYPTVGKIISSLPPLPH